MANITRTDVDSLIETQVANEIFEGVIKDSKALSMFRRLPNMTSDKTKLRVLDSQTTVEKTQQKWHGIRNLSMQQSWQLLYQ